ncbi:MAG: 6-phosphofructokinase [Candidatus Omnitrophota bacterium]
MASTKRIALLTGGGDCPGLNAVIRAVVKKASTYGFEAIGILDGWKGLTENRTMALDEKAISGILQRGGTILGTSRFNPYKQKENIEKIKANFRKLKLYALVAIGGDDTLGVANKLFLQENLRMIGVPKTIDNDLSATDFTFGFDTAVNIATECLDRLHTTAESHHRVLVVEIMGRHAGWITIYAGIAGGADVVLIPEFPIDIDEVVKNIKSRQAKGKRFSIVAVAEGAKFKTGTEVTQIKELDAFGNVRLGGIAQMLADKIQDLTKIETRTVVLGHLQRGGTPTAADRVLSTRYGIKAAELLHEGKFGYMVCLKGNKITSVKLQRAVAKTKTVDRELYEIAQVFSG